VISAVNIQHIESLNQEIKQITEVEVTERIPDAILQQANEVVNIDLTADELIDRLKEGKIYEPAKIETALKTFSVCSHSSTTRISTQRSSAPSRTKGNS
jgi:two-component system sensor histidine kinase KdpD